MALAVPPGGPTPPDDATPAPQPSPPAARRSRPRDRQLTTLTVVVVNFCQWRNTARLVRQLRRSIAVRSGTAGIAVVDNHSPAHPFARKLRRLRGVAVRRFRRNLGFARAVNRAVRTTAGDWVLLLNPDVTVPDGFLDEVLATIHKRSHDEAAGVVGFRLRNRDGTAQASSGSLPTLAGTLGGLIRPRSRRKCRHRSCEGREPVAWVTGGCLLVRRACFEQLGGLDESFFLYYEDVDFCHRAAGRGWAVEYDPTLEVIHHWPLHARAVPAPLRLITRHALLTYADKHWSRWQSGLLASVVWAEAAGRGLWARVSGNATAAQCYGELRALVGDLRAGREAEIHRRIRTAAAHLPAIAAEQDRRPG